MGILLRLYQGEEETKRSPNPPEVRGDWKTHKRRSAPRLPVNCSQSCHHRHQYSQWTVHSLVITVHSGWLWRTQDPVHSSSHPHGSLPHCRPVQEPHVTVLTQSLSVWDSQSLSTLSCSQDGVWRAHPDSASSSHCRHVSQSGNTRRGVHFELKWVTRSAFPSSWTNSSRWALLSSSFPPNPTVRPV